MISDGFKELVEQRRELLKKRISGDERKTLNDKIRDSAESLSEKIMAFNELGGDATLNKCLRSIKTIGEYQEVLENLNRNNNANDALFAKLDKISASDFEKFTCLKSVDYFGNQGTLIAMIAKDELSLELENYIINDLKKSENINILLALSNLLIDDQEVDEQLLSNLIIVEYRDYQSVFENSRIGSNLEEYIIERILYDFDNYELLLLLHTLNHSTYKTFFIDEDLFSNWISEEFDYEFLSSFIRPIFHINEHKRIELRKAIIEYLSGCLELKHQYFLLFSGFILQRDVQLLRNRKVDFTYLEWAELECKDLIKYSFGVDLYDIEIKNRVQVNYNSTAEKIIETYFNSEFETVKELCFWLLKWKIISGKDITIYDKRLSDDSRFMDYYCRLIQLAIISENRMESIFKWPTVDQLINYNKQKNHIFDNFSPESPLKKFGYSVGSTSDINEKQRHKILNHAFKDADPATLSYGWGTPDSPKRLQSISWHIARNIWRFSSQQNYDQAVSDWKRDLEFLKNEFYDDRLAAEFIWPNP